MATNKNVEVEPISTQCCGLVVHKVEIVATVKGEDIKRERRTFRSTTSSLAKLKEWVLLSGVTHVAPESTGVYRKPIFNIRECESLTILVANVRHIKYVPGHEINKKDSARIYRLLYASLLKGCFVPPQKQRTLRDQTRYRKKLVQNVETEHKQTIRMFDDAILKLPNVFCDVIGPKTLSYRHVIRGWQNAEERREPS